MQERSDGLAVFANSFRQADGFAPTGSRRRVRALTAPVIGWPAEFTAWIVCVSPTAMVSIAGTSGSLPVTVKPGALLQTPFASIRAMPLSEPVATAATTCASVQLSTVPAWLPSHTPPARNRNRRR